MSNTHKDLLDGHVPVEFPFCYYSLPGFSLNLLSSTLIREILQASFLQMPALSQDYVRFFEHGELMSSVEAWARRPWAEMI